MKVNCFIPLVLLWGLISCQSNKNEQNDSQGLNLNTCFIEKKLSFFDPFEITYADGKFQGYTYETWIRKPENLKMVHETFKKIGYKKLFSIYDNSEYCGFINDVWKPCNELIDSLILTYNLKNVESKYHREFWNRRKKEKNDSIVYAILKDVYSEVYQNKQIQYDEKFVNDTLLHLFEIEHFEDSMTVEKANSNFNYLREIGMHRSAYNLLYERYSYYEIKWNREELKKTLKTDTSKCCPNAFIEDDTK